MHASPGRPQNLGLMDFRVSNIQASMPCHHRFPALAQADIHIRCKYTAVAAQRLPPREACMKAQHCGEINVDAHKVALAMCTTLQDRGPAHPARLSVNWTKSAPRKPTPPSVEAISPELFPKSTIQIAGWPGYPAARRNSPEKPATLALPAPIRAARRPDFRRPR